MTMNPYGRVLSPGEVIEEDIPSTQEEEYRPQLAIKLICPDCQIDPPNLVEEYVILRSTQYPCNLFEHH